MFLTTTHCLPSVACGQRMYFPVNQRFKGVKALCERVLISVIAVVQWGVDAAVTVAENSGGCEELWETVQQLPT